MSVTIECKLDSIFPDLWNISGRVMLIDDVIVNVVLLSGSYSLIGNLRKELNIINSKVYNNLLVCNLIVIREEIHGSFALL